MRLERGNAAGVSESVLEGVSRALRLSDAERSHLYELVRAANDGAQPNRRRPMPRTQHVRPSLLQLLNTMDGVPAFVQNGRLDIIAINRLGRAVFSEMYVQPQRPANFGRFVFLDPLAPRFYQDWENAAVQTVALLRSEAGRSPHDRELTDLVGELATRSERFRTLWASHDVREHSTGVKSIVHPVVGAIDLDFDAMELISAPGTQLVAYSAAPSTPAREALALLASWSLDSEPASLDGAPQSTEAPPRQ